MPPSPPSYTFASLTCSSEDMEGILSWLNGHVSSAVLIEEGEPCRLVFIPPNPTSSEWLLMELALASLGAGEITTDEARQEDWQEIWKDQGFKSFSVGTTLFVTPSWEDHHDPSFPERIRVDPQMAFGTGLHETTYACLELIVETAETWGDPSLSILDFGSGTGILGVAALQLMKKATLFAIDNDPYAVEATRQNLADNGMENRAEVSLSLEEPLPQTAFRDFGMILANVTGGVLCTFAPLLYARLLPQGRMICSGVSKEESTEVKRVLSGLGGAVREVAGERYDTFVIDKVAGRLL